MMSTTIVRLSALLAACIAASAGAQTTRFEWPSAPVDVAHYATVEECLALTGRVRDSVEQSDALWRDTIALTPALARAPLPPVVTETARRCSARFAPQRVPLADFAPHLQLLLLAGRDSDAAALITRRLAAVAPKGGSERAGVLDTVIMAYMGFAYASHDGLEAQPVRLAAVEPFVAAYARMDGVVPLEERLGAYVNFTWAARLAGDTARARRGAEAYFATVRATPPAELRRDYQPGFFDFQLLRQLAGAALLDSARRGSASYLSLLGSLWTRATGQPPEALRFLPIGKPAPPITADYWFARADTTAPRPTKGKMSLIVFLDQRCLYVLGGNGCWSTYAPLRRIAQRFPQLEITLVAGTHGYLSAMAPPAPAEEAKALAHWWLDERHLPGVLAVTTTQFWRLPSPDRRRIDRDRPNEVHYFGHMAQYMPGQAFLVDRSGIVVHMMTLWGQSHSDDEVQLYRLLDAFDQQQVGGR